MTGDGFGWVACSPSLERRRWLRLAAACCGAVSLLMAAAVAAEPSAARFGGLAVALGATALALRVAHQAAQPGELRLDAAGNLWWRPTVDAQAEPLVAVGLSRWLAVFDGAGGRHSVWRDSLPPAHWRLLRAHLRWHVARDRTAPVAAAGAPDRLSNR